MRGLVTVMCQRDEFGERVQSLLAEADRVSDELGLSELWFDDTARGLAATCEPHFEVIARAWRIAVERARAEPTHHNKQLRSLIRRAMEKGEWDWRGRQP